MYHIKKDKRQMQSVAMLTEGLSLLLKEKPYEKITVKDVVEASRVGRTTFYRSFDEIKDILIYEYDNLLKDLALYIVNYLTNSSMPLGKNILKPALRFFYVENSVVQKLMMAGLHEVIRERMLDLFRDFMHNNVQINSEYKEYYIELRCAIWTSVLFTWIKNDRSIPPDDLAEYISHEIVGLFGSDL